MRTPAIIFFIFLLPISGRSQGIDDSPVRFVFLPAGSHFSPLRANIMEPRLGAFKFLDAGEMKVDIGNSIDLFGVDFPGSRITAGIDFFAYAYVTGANGLRLQIDAIDGFFGGNLTFSHALCPDSTGRLYARLRILHQSAHLVDGHYVPAEGRWEGNRGPIPFTRDFGELLLSHVSTHENIILRISGGLSYATLVRPAEIGRFVFLFSTETYYDAGSVFQEPANPYVAYSVTLNGTPAYAASHEIQLGVKFGEWNRKGPSIYLALYAGRHMFAEYFDLRMTTIGAGFTVDFF